MIPKIQKKIIALLDQVAVLLFALDIKHMSSLLILKYNVHIFEAPKG